MGSNISLSKPAFPFDIPLMLRNCLFLLACLTLVLSACEPLYVAPPSHMPLMSQAGEVHGNASLAPTGFNGQLALAPVEHLTLLAGASTYTVEFDSIREPRFRRNYAELGLGYWTRLNKFTRLEIYGGTGWGSTGDLPRRDRYRVTFLQPNFGLSARMFDAGFSPRISVVTHTEARKTANLPTYSLPSTAVCLEPTQMGRAGFNELEFQMMISRAIPINGSDFDYRRWNVSFGINLNFGKDFERYDLSID